VRRSNAFTEKRYRAREDRARSVRAHVYSLLCFVVGGIYLVWVVLNLNPAELGMSIAFLCAELACFGLFCMACLSVWQLRFKPPGGHPAPEVMHYAVDVFIPCCGEPLQVIRTTVRAASQIRWSGPLVLYVLDDKNLPEVRQIAEMFGAVYLSRPSQNIPNENAKAGNLNFGLAHSHGDCVLILDADHVAQPNIVEVLTGYMKFERVAFVQSRQQFIVPEGDPFFSSDAVFYGSFLSGCDSTNAAISCGSGVLYRRKALEELGGFATWNLVEDLTTSYELHARSWHSFYVPHAFVTGMAPDTIAGVYRQRGQWALDTLRLCLFGTPLLKKGMPWPMRMIYLTVGMAYFCTGFVFPFFYVVPLWTYLTGSFVVTGNYLEFFGLRLAYFLAMTLAMHWLFFSQQPGRQFCAMTGLFPIYIGAFLKVLCYPPGRKPGYKVNNQEENLRRNRRTLPNYILVLPQLLLFLANVCLPYMAVLTGSAPAKSIFINVFVSGVAIWTMWPVLEATFGSKRYRADLNMRIVYEFES
jgi:cellulose synthase (UDP-forming)